ncbi:MAG: hypothetical protein AAGA27_00200 [Pseudomonadota bacterium]
MKKLALLLLLTGIFSQLSATVSARVHTNTIDLSGKYLCSIEVFDIHKNEQHSNMELTLDRVSTTDTTQIYKNKATFIDGTHNVPMENASVSILSHGVLSSGYNFKQPGTDAVTYQGTRTCRVHKLADIWFLNCIWASHRAGTMACVQEKPLTIG